MGYDSWRELNENNDNESYDFNLEDEVDEEHVFLRDFNNNNNANNDEESK